MCARDYINSVEYSGPVALACDDTKLHPSLQVYWDTTLETHILVGTTSTKTIAVSNPEELKQLLLKHEEKAATKVVEQVVYSILSGNWTCRIYVFFELLFSYVSSQFPSMFLLLTYSQSFFSLPADYLRHSR